MSLQGGCYCKTVRYEVDDAKPLLKAQCHCRECQYVTGGGPNYFMAVPADSFRYTAGTPKSFARSDLEKPVTREFCANCGTHLLTRPSRMQGVAVVKVGTLDDPSDYGGPTMAIFTCDKQDFHEIPKDIKAFEKFPG